jgi:hypothetical protein
MTCAIRRPTKGGRIRRRQRKPKKLNIWASMDWRLSNFVPANTRIAHRASVNGLAEFGSEEG